jgi:hypothetical protein
MTKRQGRVLGLGLVLILLASVAPACNRVYYSALERAGFPKRDLLVKRVEGARNSQEDAKEQFQTALERFSEVVFFEGGDLEDKYKKLSRELERSERKAAEVHERVASVENVARALFREWEAELREYNNAELRRQSQRKMDDTYEHYRKLITAMKRAEERIDPVLTPMRDQVLFLKHNLNAKAIASLQGELRIVEADVADLIRQMQASITEADEFIRAMNRDT